MLVPTPLRHLEPGDDREEDIPTSPQEPEANPWLPQAHAHPGRTRGVASSPPQGAQAADGERLQEVTCDGPAPARTLAARCPTDPSPGLPGGATTGSPRLRNTLSSVCASPDRRRAGVAGALRDHGQQEG